MPASAYITTLLNPWVENPAGIADEFSMPTQCIKLRSASTGAISTGGHAVSCFHPWAIGSGAGPTYFETFCTFTAATTTIASYLNANHPDINKLNADVQRFRVVSVGVKVYYVGAEQSTAGTISIVPLVSTYPSLTGPTMPVDAAAWLNHPGAKTVACAAMTGPLCGAFHSFDRPRFHEGGDFSSQAVFPSFAVVAIGGEAGKAFLRMELECNIEVLPKLVTTFNANAYSVAVHNAGAQNISRRLDSTRVGSLSHVTSMTHAMLGSGSRSSNKPGKGIRSYKRKRTPMRRAPRKRTTRRKKKRTTRRRR